MPYKKDNVFTKFIRKLRRHGYVSGTTLSSSVLYYDFGGGGLTSTNSNDPNSLQHKDTREAKKPVEIYNEIISESPILDLTNLDEKIKIVYKRLQALEELGMHPTDENTALQYLRARKKFKEYSELKWAATNQDLINKLCAKYKVKQVTFNLYYKSVPNEGIDEIEKFAEIFKKIIRKEDITNMLHLIIDDGGEETKKDPILLAKSPFGNYFYILGAWDKEVEIVDKLVYNA